jgi:hypothetical protein
MNSLELFGDWGRGFPHKEQLFRNIGLGGGKGAFFIDVSLEDLERFRGGGKGAFFIDVSLECVERFLGGGEGAVLNDVSLEDVEQHG